MKNFNRMVLVAAMMLAVVSVRAEVVVVVSAKSTVSQLDKDQVADIFLGNAASLPGGGKAEPIDQAAGAAVREEFYTKVTGRNAAQIKAHWAKQSFSGKGAPPKSAASDDELKKLLAANPNAIGYLEKSKVDASVKTVLAP